MSKLLKAARIVKGVTAQELATHLGISEISYLELENQIGRLSPYHVQLLAVYYSLPVYYFEPDHTLRRRAAQLHQRLDKLVEQPRSQIAPKTKAAIAEELRKSLVTEMMLREELTSSLAKQLELTERLMDTEKLYRTQYLKSIPSGN